ncbi:MAG TPA: AmmeMemoRadiSam system protein A [Vicinamibacterales bacterium]|jgi:AmmeMemoRadiSam system protein A
MLSSEERKALLRFARETIGARLTGSAPPAALALAEPHRHAGAFVTLHADGELRGCIGYPGSEKRLDEVVGHCAVAAATEDPRFPQLGADEMENLTLEISVLTPIVPVTDVSEIEVGRDGLVIEEGFRRGLLLPQVATEHRWNRDTFLAHTCLKAGLRPDAWKSGARVSRFQAEVFSE